MLDESDKDDLSHCYHIQILWVSLQYSYTYRNGLSIAWTNIYQMTHKMVILFQLSVTSTGEGSASLVIYHNACIGSGVRSAFGKRKYFTPSKKVWVIVKGRSDLRGSAHKDNSFSSSKYIGLQIIIARRTAIARLTLDTRSNYNYRTRGGGSQRRLGASQPAWADSARRTRSVVAAGTGVRTWRERVKVPIRSLWREEEWRPEPRSGGRAAFDSAQRDVGI